jgi:hypothetical protein
MEYASVDRARQVRSNAARSRRIALESVLTAALGGLVGGIIAPAGGLATRKKRRKKKKPALHVAFECPGPTNGESLLLADGRVGQVFLAARSGALRQVRVGLIKNSAPAPGDYLVQLLTANVSPLVPHNSPVAVIAAKIVPEGSVPEGVSTLVASFSGPALVAGNAYAVVVTRRGSTADKVQTHLSNVCAGAWINAVGTDAFAVDINADARLTVLVD